MALTLTRISFPDDTKASVVLTETDGTESAFVFSLDDNDVVHAEQAFTEAYLAVPGPDVPQAHVLTRVIGDLLRARRLRLPSGDELAEAWSAVGDELEHDWSLQDEQPR